MPLAIIRPVGQGGLYFIQTVDAVDPGFGVGGGRPDQGLPGGSPDHIWGGVGGRPDRPDQGLPGGGNYPSHGLPGSPGHPDNRPPATRPPQVEQNTTLVLVRDPEGVWHYATLQPGSPPPRPVPVPPPDHISGRPPGSGGGGNYPSGQPVPPQPDQGLPPTAQPKK